LNTAYINAGSPAIPAATFFTAPAGENSTITPTGPVAGFNNQDFFAVGGADRFSNSYGVARFDMAHIKQQFDQRYGAGNWVVDNVALAVETNGSSCGSIRVFLATNDGLNIQQGSALRFTDNGVPLGVDISTATPLLDFAVPIKTKYTISRYDKATLEALNWTPLTSDILGGNIITLIAAAGSTTSSASYFGGAGLSLEVSAHQVPEPALGGLLAGAGAGAGAAVLRGGRKRQPA
jgi:hypothetical protein